MSVPLPTSLAVAPLFQLFSAARLPAPSHSTVLSAGAVTTGGVLSSTVMVWLHEAELPHSSVAVQVRLVAYLILPPVAQLPAMAVSAWVRLTEPHRSLGAGSTNSGMAGHSMVLSAAQAIVGGGSE